MFINYMLDVEIATANAEYICYASPNDAVRNNPDYALYGNEYLYPDADTVVPTEYYHNLPAETKALYNDLWSELKIENSGSGDTAVYIICGGILALGAVFAVYRAVIKHKRAKAYEM